MTVKYCKSNPCSKVDIYNCFRTRRGYRRVSMDEVKTEHLGLNVPRRLLENGRADTVIHEGVEYMFLTEAGKTWIERTLPPYLKRNPHKAKFVQYMPKAWRDLIYGNTV